MSPFLTIENIKSKLVLVTPELIRRKPFFLCRIFFRTLFSQFGLKRPIQSVLFHTHYKCNLHCSHCYEKNFTKTDQRPLTLDEKLKAIHDLSALGALSYDFVSGESSLDPDLPKLVKACRPAKTYITLATNGYDFSKEKIKYFREIGIDKLNISVDSIFPEEHDRIRGRKDSHKNALKTIDLCKKTGMDFHITVFVYKDSTKLEGFNKLVEYAIANRIRTTFKAAVPLGSFEGRHDSLITEDDRIRMFDLHRKHPFLVRTCIGTSNSTCPAFNRMITLTAYGDVLPCNAVHVSFGNIRDNDLSAIITRGKNIEFFNGQYRGCPSSEDMNFINKYLSKTYSVYPYPVKAEKVFFNDNLSGA